MLSKGVWYCGLFHYPLAPVSDYFLWACCGDTPEEAYALWKRNPAPVRYVSVPAEMMGG